MAQVNVEAWQRNLAAKILEAEQEVYRFMIAEITDDPSWPSSTKASIDRHRTLVRKQGVNSALKEISNVAGLYDEGNRPAEIEKLSVAVSNLHLKRSSPQSAIDVILALEQLKKVPVTGAKYVSFHDIYEQYRDDGELNQLVDQLVTALEKIIEEDDGSLSSKIEKDITNLLNQIKNRPKLSTYEIGAWAELTGKFVLGLIGQQHGVPQLILLVDAAKLSKKIFDNVCEKYQASQSEYVRLIGLKTAPESFSSLPPLSEATIVAAEMKAEGAQPAKLPLSSKTPQPPGITPPEAPST